MTVCVQNTYVKTKSYAGKLAMLRHLKTFLNHIRPSAPPECINGHEKKKMAGHENRKPWGNFLYITTDLTPFS